VAGVDAVGKMVFTGRFVFEAFEPIRGVGRGRGRKLGAIS